jgi:hypothetical protein
MVSGYQALIEQKNMELFPGYILPPESGEDRRHTPAAGDSQHCLAF